MREGDKANFKRLAETRTNRAIKNIRLLGNLSNRSNYSYTDEQVKRIASALRDEVMDMVMRFASEEKPKKPTFSLEGNSQPTPEAEQGEK